jgi:DNA-binding NarL/FixJ family response regulator/class 3 adenylate cyclase
MTGGASGRSLLTVLFTDIVGSTRLACDLGDVRWRKLLDRHDAMIRTALKNNGGREVSSSGDGFMATFDAPARAIRCAESIVGRAPKLGLEIRAGIHTGECEIRGMDIGGIAVHIASRIGALAAGNEVLVSGTVKDLVAGADFEFASHGSHALKGVPGRWRLFVLVREGVSPGLAAPRRPSSKPVTVMIVDDHPLWRSSLRKVLALTKKVSVVAEASDGAEAIATARREQPDVVIMDVDLPELDGIDATRRMLEDRAGGKVLMLSSSTERAQVIECMRAGASGYLVKTADAEEIAEAVQRVAAGEMVLPPELTSVIRDALRAIPPAETHSPLRELTKRERVVLELMAEGRSNAAISERLQLSPKTVEGHVANIFMKLRLEPADDDHRRVLAVVTYLRESPQG